tara:strand:- start:7 stop:927 length:921 start_codon:yes stop_codon:yes gene_type:complete
MFQVTYGKMFEKKFDAEFRTVSSWEGDILFKNCKSKLIKDKRFRENLVHYGKQGKGHTWDKWNEIVQEHNKKTKDNVQFIYPYHYDSWVAPKTNLAMDCACWDSEYLFGHYNKRDLRKLFEFSDEVIKSDVYKRAEDKQGTYDIAHLRRDDIVFSKDDHNWNYPVISRASYEKAFKTFDVDSKKVEWISDDFPSHPNMGWKYPEGQRGSPGIFFDFFPDFLKLYFARNIFRANSSFSWWASFLSPVATVYSPILHDRILYYEEKKELNCEFIQSNAPHFMHVLGYSFGEECPHKGYHSCPFINIKD